MPKGMFTQGIAILLSETVKLDTIIQILEQKFEIVKKIEKSTDWVFGGPTVVLNFLPEVNGLISLDIVDREWPDDMGDPKENSMLFGAWSMGHFGPFAYPGNLERAVQQTWDLPDARKYFENHKAFIRIRSSYVFGHVNNKAPVIPAGYNSMQELLHITSIARELLKLKESMCCFNPNGERICSGEIIDSLIDRQAKSGLPPLEIWSNIRLFNVEDWLLMDTVGMEQLDVSDQEAVFERNSYNPNQVAVFLRNISDYLLNKGPIIKDGDTTDGPGGLNWQAKILENSITDPPRPILRWIPMDGKKMPSVFNNQEK